MSFGIVNDRVLGVPFVPAHASGSAMRNPTLIVLHDTADRAQPKDTVNWFKSSACTVSAHFVVERDGSVTQMVECDQKAFHAGKSSFKGRSGCNNFAIGIEIDNPGKLDKQGRAWFHKKGEAGYSGIVHKVTPAHGDGCWLPYTNAQVEAVTELCKALVRSYPSITDISTHWEVSPGRKVDTNPLFPLDDVRAATFEAPQHRPAPVVPETASGPTVTAETLVATSRKAKGSRNFKRIWQGVSISGVLASLGLAKDTSAQVGTVIADHWLAILITVAILCILFAKWLEGLMQEDVEEGRAMPSGEA